MLICTTKLQHQHPFIRTIYRQGWSRANSGGPSNSDLDMAYVKYEDFLQRIVTPERREPGLEDDLIWHTHQLMPKQYRCVRYMEVLIDMSHKKSRVNVVSYIGVFLNHLPAGENGNGYRKYYCYSMTEPLVF